MLNMLCTNFLTYSLKMISAHRTDASSRNSLTFLLSPLPSVSTSLASRLKTVEKFKPTSESSKRLLDQCHNFPSEVLELWWDSSVCFEMTSQLCIFCVLLMWVIHCTTCESWNVDFPSFGIRGNTLSMFSSYLTNSFFNLQRSTGIHFRPRPIWVHIVLPITADHTHLHLPQV